MKGIEEIEQLINLCPTSVAEVSPNEEQFGIIENVVLMRKHNGRFNREGWRHNSICQQAENDSYHTFIEGTLEDRMAEFCIYILSLANKYNMDLHSLRLGKEQSKVQNFEKLVYGLLKVGISDYNIYKKIIVLLGMILCYCMKSNIDIVFFIKKRLSAQIKLV